MPFYCPFSFFSDNGRNRAIMLIAFWFLFLRFQSLVMEAGWETSEDNSVIFYDGIWIGFN